MSKQSQPDALPVTEALVPVVREPADLIRVNEGSVFPDGTDAGFDALVLDSPEDLLSLLNAVFGPPKNDQWSGPQDGPSVEEPADRQIIIRADQASSIDVFFSYEDPDHETDETLVMGFRNGDMEILVGFSELLWPKFVDTVKATLSDRNARSDTPFGEK